MAEPSPIGALRDSEFWKDYMRGLRDVGYRGFATLAGGPVDIAQMALSPMGYSVPDKKVVGSSPWIEEKMHEVGLIDTPRNPLADFLAAILMGGAFTNRQPGGRSTPRDMESTWKTK